MREEHLQYLACPGCGGGLSLAEVRARTDARVREGLLRCVGCGRDFPIVGHIPRFVPMENYATNFGFQWDRHGSTQLDSYSGTTISEERFFRSTEWPRSLDGEVILEAGSGAGRFTQQAVKTGATVVSFDYSQAVEKNYLANGHLPNVLIVQGNIYEMPVPDGAFDRVFCLGVLQHTPDPRAAFHALLRPLKPGGHVAIDVYPRRWWTPLRTKYWVRPITRRIPTARLYRLIEGYIRVMWPVASQINRLPLGRKINSALLISDYRGKFPLDEEQLREWAVLDTFDRLSPRYDKPQSLAGVREWFRAGGVRDVSVGYGWNGVVGRGRKPEAA